MSNSYIPKSKQEGYWIQEGARRRRRSEGDAESDLDERLQDGFDMMVDDDVVLPSEAVGNLTSEEHPS